MAEWQRAALHKYKHEIHVNNKRSGRDGNYYFLEVDYGFDGY